MHLYHHKKEIFPDAWTHKWCMTSQHFLSLSCKTTPFVFLHTISFYHIAFKACIGVEYRIIHIIHGLMSYHAHDISSTYHMVSCTYHIIKHVTTCTISTNMLHHNIYCIINTSHYNTCHNINITYHNHIIS